MATTATMLAVPVTGAKTNNMSTSIESTKRKNQEILMSNRRKQPAQSDEPSSIHPTMITEYEMNNEDGAMIVNGSTGSRPTSRVSIEKPRNQMFFNGEKSSLSIQSSNVTEVPITNSLSNSEVQNSQGKRKFSVSQYREHKRLKSSEINENGSGDIDMRLPFKASSPPQNVEKITTDSTTVGQRIESKNRTNAMNVIKKSNLSEPGLRKVLKKKVIWADEKQLELVQTSCFEIDDCERMSKRSFAQQFANPMSIAQFEKLHERHFLQQQNRQDYDDRSALPPLPALIRIQLPSTMPNPVVKSHQRIVQEDRERTVLQALFIGSLIADSPSEPDFDSTEDCTIETKSIPLEDDSSTQVTSEPQTTSVTSVSLTDSKENTVSSLSSISTDTMSPQVAQILATARGNLTATTSISQNLNPLLPTTHQMMPGTSTPNLLSTLLAGTQNVNIPPINPLANLLSSIQLQFNPLTSSLFSAVSQTWPNGMPAVVPGTTPIPQQQQVSPPQPVNLQQNFPNSNNEIQAPRRDQSVPNHHHNTSKFPNKYFNQRGNPNHRKQHYRRGPANGNRRNFFSDRNAYD